MKEEEEMNATNQKKSNLAKSELRSRRFKCQVKSLVIRASSLDDECESPLSEECLLNIGVIESENKFYEFVSNQFKDYINHSSHLVDLN